MGIFDYRHIQISWFQGYQRIDLGNEQTAFIARPEKASLDLVYLQPGDDSENYLRSLHLQALDQMDQECLCQITIVSGKPKLLRAMRVIERIIEEEGAIGFEVL